jgi:TP901 family phage tail tape measure protein
MAVNFGEIFAVFGADTSPLVKSQKEVDSISKNMQKKLLNVTKDGEELLKKVNTDGVKKADSEVNKAAKNIQSNLEKTNNEGEKLLKNVPVKGIEEAEKKVNNFAETVKKKFTAIGDKMKSTGDKMKSVGGNMTALTAPVTAFGVISLKAATDFNEGMSKIATLIPKQTEYLYQLKDAAQEMGIEYGKSPKEVADGMYQVISAFGDTSDVLGITRSNLTASVAGFTQLTDAVNLTSAWVKAYNDVTAEGVNKANDLAFQIVKLGVTDYPQLAQSMGEVLPAAAALGVKQEELAASYATLTGVTGKANKVSTQLNATFVKLLAPTDAMSKALTPLIAQMTQEGKISGDLVNQYFDIQKAYSKTAEEMEMLKSIGQENTDEYKQNKEALKGLSKEYQTATAGLIPLIVQKEGFQTVLMEAAKAADGNSKKLVEMIGSEEALKAVLALIGPQADTFNEKLKKMYEATGSTSEAFQEASGGINEVGFQMKQATAQIEVLMEKTGDELMPLLGDLLSTTIMPLVQDGLIPMLKEFNTWDATTKKVIIALGSIVVALGPFLFLLGTVISSVGTIVGSLGGLASAALPSLGAAFSAVASVISGAVTAALGTLTVTFGVVAAAIVSVGFAVYQLIKYWDDVKATTEALVTALKYKFKDLDLQLKIYTANIYNSAKTYLVDKFNSIKKSVVDFVNYTIDYWKQAPNKIANYVKQIYEGIKLWLVDRMDSIVVWVQAKIDAIIAAFRAASDLLVGNSIVPDMINAIGSEFDRLEDVMVKPAIEYTKTLTRVYDRAAKKIRGISFAPAQREYARLSDILALTNGVPIENIGPVGDVGLYQLRAQMGETLSYTQQFIQDMSYLFEDLTYNASYSVEELEDVIAYNFNSINGIIKNSFEDIESDVESDLSSLVSTIENKIVDINNVLSLIGIDLAQIIQQNLLNVTGSGGPFDEFISNLISITQEISDVLALPGNEFEDSFTTAMDNIVDYFNDTFITDMLSSIDDFIAEWENKIGTNWTSTGTFKGIWGQVVSDMNYYFEDLFNGSSGSIVAHADTFLSAWSDFANGLMFAWQSALNFVATGAYFTGGEVQGYASGGKVNGPGGIDNVPAWLTAGEYVIPKDSVDYYGKDLFERLRARKFLDGGIVDDGIITVLQKPYNEVMTMPSNQNSFTVGAPMMYDNTSANILSWMARTYQVSSDGINKNTQTLSTWDYGSGTWAGKKDWKTLLIKSDLMAPTGWYCDDLINNGISSPPYSMGDQNYFSTMSSGGGFSKSPLLQALGNRAGSTYTDAWFPAGFYDYADMMGINIDGNWLNPSLNYHTGGLVDGGLVNTLPDEYVMQPSAVSHYGVDMMDDINDGSYQSGTTVNLYVTVEGNIIDNPSAERDFFARIADKLDDYYRKRLR